MLGEGDAQAAAESCAESLPPSSADPDSLAAILYTSGSTGRPKGVMLSHANMWLGAESVATYLGLAADDRVLGVLPLSFDYGQNQLLSAWYAGASVAPLDYLTPRDVLKAVERHAITTLAAVPPLWVQLAELDWPGETAARLRRLTNSGGALTPDLVRRLRGLFPQARLFAMYGLTEAFRSTFLDPALIDSHPTSMGKAIPHAEILVIGENGAVTADDEEGELVHCGPLVAQGYWQRCRADCRALQARAGGFALWRHGSLVGRPGAARCRRAALFRRAARRDDQVGGQPHQPAGDRGSRARFRVWWPRPSRWAFPTSGWGRRFTSSFARLRAALTLRKNCPACSCSELPNFMQPKHIHWREAMPIGPNGKIDRTGLQQDLAA